MITETRAIARDAPQLDTYPAPEGYPLGTGTPIRLVPVADIAQSRRFLVRWLWLYRMVRITRDLDHIATHEGKRSARRAGYRRGVFVD